MSHSINYNPDAHIIEIEFHGDIVLDEVKTLLSELSQIAKEKKCFKFLSDFRETTMKLSTLEIYGLPKIYSDIFNQSGLSLHQIKRALVVAKDLKDYHFFETVTSNNAQRNKVFQSIDEAKKWLLE